ncbi:hypothetical protein NQZ68_016244 [Dissostichus eleginoides]|nr:hypothetical protein NQZ68_016244 [Dissostichus eleginoides]
MPEMLQLLGHLASVGSSVRRKGAGTAWKPGREKGKGAAGLFTSSLKLGHHLKITLGTSDNMGSLSRGQTPQLISPCPGQSVEEFKGQLITAIPSIKSHTKLP